MPPEKAWDVNTPEQFAEMCEIIKEGILECLNQELVPETVVPGEKIPKVKNRRVIDLIPDTWAGKLKSDRHLAEDGKTKKVHTYMVDFGGITSVNDDNTVGGKSFQLRFMIDSYYEDEIGTDADNPGKRHSEEVHRIVHKLWMSRTLKRPKFVKKIVDLSERRGFARMGQTLTRESLGELIVDLHAVRMVPPA